MKSFLGQPFYEADDASFLEKRNDYNIAGCVSCPESPPACSCNSHQTCTLISGTCDTCAYNQCTDKPGGGTSKNIGGIVGGVVGGICFIVLIVGFIVWSHQKKKRSNRFLRLEAQDKEILGEERDEDDDEGYQDENNHTAKFVPRVQVGSDSIALANLANKNYQDFHNQARTGVNNNSDATDDTIPVGSPDTFTNKEKSNNFRKSMVTSPQPSSSYSTTGSKYKGRRASSYRNSTQSMTSIATSALSRASNIIPIAYIPGVKAKSNSTLINNRLIRDDYIHEDDEEDDLRNNSNNFSRQKTFVGSPLSTTTAVRAVPKLVDVQKKTITLSQVVDSNANDATFGEDDMSSLTSAETLRRNNLSLKALNDKQSKEQKNRLSSRGLTHIIEEYDNDDQSDLISIGSNSDDDYYNTSNKRNTIRSFMSSTLRPSSGLLNISEGGVNPFDDQNHI